MPALLQAIFYQYRQFDFFWFFISRPISVKRRSPFNKELIAKDFMLNQTWKNGNIW